MYELIRAYTDLESGKAQDRIREKYTQLLIKPTDSMATIVKQVDLKYYLWSKNQLFTHDSERGQKAGNGEVAWLSVAWLAHRTLMPVQ